MVVVLCLTEIVSWGVLFYAFPVLAATISDAQDWPLTQLVAVFTAAQLVAAAAGIWVGHRIDRHGPRLVMTGGSALAVVAVIGIALAPNLPTFAAAWVLAGFAMSATLYPPAFTTITHWAAPQDRVRALTAVTLVAGFASTVFAPLAALLLAVTDWRASYLILAAVLATTIPVHWCGLHARWQTGASDPDQPIHQTDLDASQGAETGTPRSVLRQPEFVLLAVAFTLAGFCVYAVVINLVPLLLGGGLTTGQAAIALGVGGAGQVAGRLLYAPVLTRFRVRARTIAVLGAASLTSLALAAAAGSMLAACLASFAAGTARGVFTLIQATAVTDRWGTTAYGRRSSILSGCVMTASAFAPWAGAMLAAATGGYGTAFVILAAGAGASTLLVRPVRSSARG